MTVSAIDLLEFPIADQTATVHARDAMLYALSTGYVETSLGSEFMRYHDNNQLEIASTFANVLAHCGPWLQSSGINWAGVVHAEHRLTLHHPIAVGDDILSRTRCVAVVDRAEKGAFVTFERMIERHRDGLPLATIVQTDACRFDGGCGSAGVPATPLQKVPARVADHVFSVTIPAHAALLYRLNGDLNRLHCDTNFAVQAGFPKPILHGLCTFGYAACLLNRIFPYRSSLDAIAARFTGVVFPGDELIIEIWEEGEAVQFRGSVSQRDSTVLDNGHAVFSTATDRT